MSDADESSLAIRGKILHFVDEPAVKGEQAWEYFEDGILWVEAGRVKAVGEAASLLPQLSGELTVQEYSNHLIIPGFIDTHIHYPQVEMIAAYGEQLLEWLDNYTFPTELQFSDPERARQVADIFLDELLRNGTTTALVFATVHPESVDAFFSAAQAKGLRMISGKVLMDRHAPADLCDTAQSGYEQSRELIERWHGVDRLSYAITPRFAPTCSEEQLAKAGQLLQEYEGLYLHTHLAENRNEIAWVKELFPEAPHYLGSYDNAGLLGRRSVFAHGVHLCDDECERLAATGSSIAHCPTSNLFLGSGLFDMEKLQQHKVSVSLGTDVGAGTSFSMFKTMDEAYKIQQLRGNKLDPFQALYLATLAGARALDLEGCIGNFAPGCEADFLVLDLAATPLMAFRTPHCKTLQELLFVLNTLGDDRTVACTYSMGKLVHGKTGAPQRLATV